MAQINHTPLGYSFLTMLDLRTFDDLYATYRQLVLGVAIRILHNQNEAEDVAQTIFLKAWMNPAAFRGGNVESWLTILAKNCAIDVLRRHRHELTALPAESLRFAASPDDTEEIALAELRAKAVREALRHLRDEQRALVVASFLLGESHERIARSTSLPLGTVKTRIRSGLAHLRKLTAAL